MGWNQLRPVAGLDCPFVDEFAGNPYTYYVHSYYAAPSREDITLATCDYGVRFPAVVGQGNIYAFQFHPEKSQAAGIAMLRAFGNLA